jgi:translocation and assembly module TamB
MRALKIALLTVLITVIMLTVAVSWLARTEPGSRWLLEQGLGFVPITIEASGIAGTLAEGLEVDKLYIALPLADIRASDIRFRWSPLSLLSGIVAIEHAVIAELDVDILEADSSNGTAKDANNQPADEYFDEELFWLQIPLLIYIESGQLDKLRIDAVEFDKLSVVGTIGYGRLEIDALGAAVAGFNLQARGKLAGPDPGQLHVDASWEMPAQKITGVGSFSGNIEQLEFTQVINVPEVVNFNGLIYDLFTDPRLEGTAVWSSIRIPGESVLFSNNGNISINSDFLSAQINGRHVVQLEDWPQAPMQLTALADLDGVNIESYAIDVFDGHITGAGQIKYSDGLQGQLAINGEQIDTGLIHSDVPGKAGFDASLQIQSVDAFALDVASLRARIVDRDVSAKGRMQWRDAGLSAINTSINAGTNRLTANVTLGKQLTGKIDADAPELAMLWPGLQGALNAAIVLAGTAEHPQLRIAAQAQQLSFDSKSLETVSLRAELQGDNRLDAELLATGLTVGEQALGDLDFDITGTLAEHRSHLNLAGGVVDVKLSASGGWDGKQLRQRFDSGQVHPKGFTVWQLQQEPVLLLATEGGQLDAHCWKQQEASICSETSQWSAEGLKTAIALNHFALNSLQPLLVEGYSINGMVNAELNLMRDMNGLQADLRWRQSATVLGYADEIDQFQAKLDEINIDLISDANRTNLDANLRGEEGLNVSATARVNGPLQAESPLTAKANGRLPSIGLLRPLIQRVVNPGELQGELTINLEAGGTLSEPVFTGGAYLKQGKLGLVDAGIILSEINIAAESKGTEILKVTGGFRSGEGVASILGEVRGEDDVGLVADIKVKGADLAAVRLPNLNVDASPDLGLHITENVFDITGTLAIPRTKAQIRQLPKTAVPRSADVVVHVPEGDVAQKKETIVTGDVEVVLGDKVHFNGFGLDSRLDGKLRLKQERGGYLRSEGTVRVREGFLTGYGKELRVDHGELTFTGPLDDPLINIQVSRESIYEGRQYTIGLRLSGSAQNVKTEPFSRPAMSERDVLAFLLLDRPTASDEDASGAALALGLQQLFPGERSVFGLDEVSFETNDANEAAMVAGKRINDKLYVRYVFGTLGEPGAFRIRYRLGRGFSLEASTGSNQSMDLIYLLER